MIGSLRGKVLIVKPTYAVIEAAGVGFEVHMSTNALAMLPPVDSEAFVWTIMNVREDGVMLFGFSSEEERTLFERLTGVTGIGPKVALSALASFTPSTLSQAIATGDVSKVSSIPGVGKKTASRIVLELKGSLDDLVDSSTLFDGPRPISDDAASSTIEALLGMGFSSEEAQLAIRGYSGSSDDTSDLLRYALKRLGAR